MTHHIGAASMGTKMLASELPSACPASFAGRDNGHLHSLRFRVPTTRSCTPCILLSSQQGGLQLRCISSHGKKRSYKFDKPSSSKRDRARRDIAQVQQREPDDADTDKPENLTGLAATKAKIKELWHRYGRVAIGTYCVLYVGGWAGFYFAMTSGLVDQGDYLADMVKWCAEKVSDGWSEGFYEKLNSLREFEEANPQSSVVAKAMFLNEIIDPLRDIVLIAIVPTIARKLGRAPPKEES